MYRSSFLFGGALALVLLTAIAQPARAQTFPPTSIPPAESTDPDDQRIRALMDAIQQNGITLDGIADDFAGYLAAAYAAYYAGNEEAFRLAVINMQLCIGQYSLALTYSLYFDWNELLTLDPSLLPVVLGYIEDQIDRLEAMIEALRELQSLFEEDQHAVSWYAVIGTDINNLESLVSNLWLFGFQFLYDYGAPPPPPPPPGTEP